MEYNFVPMTSEYANAIVDRWKYPGEYAIYDYSNEAEHMLDPSAWETSIFAVLDRTGELVGELSIEFFDEFDQYTEYEQFGDHALINSREMWIGFGLSPDLVGQGRGARFVEACARYAVDHYQYRGEYIRLGVARFNQRAIKAYEKAGFEIYRSAKGQIAGQEFEVVYMRKRICFD